MMREKLITKQAMDRFCKGKEWPIESINDDLESLFEDIRLDKRLKTKSETYFLPRLTEDELDLVERRDFKYLNNFLNYMVDGVSLYMVKNRAHLDGVEFKQHHCWRKTYTLSNPLPQNDVNCCSLQ